MLKGTFGGHGQSDEVPAAAADLPVDPEARRAQLNELKTALTELPRRCRPIQAGW